MKEIKHRRPIRCQTETTSSTEESLSEDEPVEQTEKKVESLKNDYLGSPNARKRFTTPSTKRHQTPAPKATIVQTEVSSNRKYLWLILIVLVLIVMFKSPKATETDSYMDKINCSKFMDLKAQFKNQDRNLFKSLKTGIEGSFTENPVPSVFSLFSTDEEFTNKVMTEVIKITTQCINQTHEPLNLTKENFGSHIIENIKEELMKRNVLIIQNIDQIHNDAGISSIHSLCDTFSPLVRKSVIFLTIRVPSNPEGKPVEFFHEYLNDQWKQLASNIREPLISRVLDQAFFLKPE